MNDKEKVTNEKDIQEKRIYLSKKSYITLRTLILVILGFISLIISTIVHIRVIPLKRKLEQKEEELDNLFSKIKFLEISLLNTKQSYSILLAQTSIPILLFPIDGMTVTGQQIPFKWDYKNHNKFQDYILEIKNVKNNKVCKIDVLNPEQKLMHLFTNTLHRGQNLWRIIPGCVSKGKEFIEGPCSNYGVFTFYPSIIDKICQTKKIIVGTSLTSTGFFNFKSNGADIQGFDIDLINWISEKLSEKLLSNGNLELQIIDVPFDNLLLKLKQKELDIVISSMTATKEREEKYKGIKFTDGYFESHQIFIQSNLRGEFPKALHRKIVGVSMGTTNERAANFLSRQFKFKIDNSYKSYADLYEALEENKVDFALVDDILVKGLLGKRFYQFGKPLDGYLKSFYKDVIGKDKEMYAIAVLDERPNKLNLLTMINETLYKEGKNILRELNEKWIR